MAPQSWRRYDGLYFNMIEVAKGGQTDDPQSKLAREKLRGQLYRRRLDRSLLFFHRLISHPVTKRLNGGFGAVGSDDRLIRV
jgi:hypothetical protein